MKRNPKPPVKQLVGLRLDPDLIMEAKILGLRERRPLNNLTEEALRDLLKKYKVKT